ncbi:MAG TPA: HAD family hydrolase [Brachybacterium sp.]|nr:HAD family hydrolase [Brachybacterium sp.]
MTTAPRGPQPAPCLSGPAPAVLTAARPDSPRPVLPAPRALLLDFGGVVISTTPRLTWARELAEIVVERARAVGTVLEADEVEDSLRVGRSALSLWKNAASRRLAPRELAPREIVEDFLLADLPSTVRGALALDAQELLAAMAPLVAEHHLRPGVAELLTECGTRGIRLGIVSNAHSGRAHRTILEDLRLTEAFGVQIYSDEVGIRKPHPDMIRLAAEALGVTPAEVWYVGDTLDRDVVAGRRAGVGAVVITRDRRTDHPPFRITDTPDLVLDTPEGLLEPLREALDGDPAPQADQIPSSAPERRPALLLDHGGVITLSTPNPQRFAEVAARIVALSQRIGSPIDLATAERAAAEGWDRHRARKRARDASTDPAHRHEEIDPALLWGDLVGADLPAPLRAALRLEGAQLSLLLHRNKNLPAPRPGAVELIRWCHENGIVVGIVSNTISGRGVREILARYGLTAMIGPAAYSDEVGVRKPGGAIFEAALAGLGTHRADVVYVGDKALNDGRGGRDAGIGTICLLRGGKDPDEALDAAVTSGDADHVLDSPAQVIDVLAAMLPAEHRCRPSRADAPAS